MKTNGLDLTELNDVEFEQLHDRVVLERERRDNLRSLPQVIAQNAAFFRSIGGSEAELMSAITPEDE